MELCEISKEIIKKINQIEIIRAEIKERGIKKAVANSDYDKKIAITIIKLKNGAEMQLENEFIKNPPATIIDKIARGICWQEKLNMDKADSEYKSCISNLDAVQSQLNAYQSLNRYQDKI